MRRYSILVQFAPDSVDDPDIAPWWVVVPALPGCFTVGRTIEQPIDRAREAIGLHIEGLAASGEPIPQEPIFPSIQIVDVADIPAATVSA